MDILSTLSQLQELGKSDVAFILGVLCIILAIIKRFGRFVELSAARSFVLAIFGLCLVVFSFLVAVNNRLQ
ncbi:MAG: hypothetical protein R3E39_08080 [Anaerolineae bacterium]